MSSFTQKELRVTVMLSPSTGATFADGSNTIVITERRMIANVQAAANGPFIADVRVFGLSASDMNAMTLLWFKPPAITDQSVIVEANDGTGWVTVFQGNMIEAQPDYRAAPDVFFRMLANAAYFDQIAAVPPLSYAADTDVATIVEAIAGTMGFKFENNGVSAKLKAGAYFAGTSYDQLRKVCHAADADFYFQGNILAITPARADRTDIPLVVLNRDSGLAGYPVIEHFGITVDCLFNPAITAGGRIKVESEIPSANGTWIPYALIHELESRVPGGQWMSQLSCQPVPQ